MNRYISYLITDPKYYSNNLLKLKLLLKRAVKRHHLDIVCFRDKSSSNIKSLAINFLKEARVLNVGLVLINDNIDIAYRYGFDGVHLPSYSIDKIKEAKRKGLFVVVSTHNFYEIEKAVRLKADMVTFSPIFYTPNKGKPKGLKVLRKAVLFSKIPVIALGGIVKKYQIDKTKINKAKGFASIRYFVK